MLTFVYAGVAVVLGILVGKGLNYPAMVKGPMLWRKLVYRLGLEDTLPYWAYGWSSFMNWSWRTLVFGLILLPFILLRTVDLHVPWTYPIVFAVGFIGVDLFKKYHHKKLVSAIVDKAIGEDPEVRDFVEHGTRSPPD